MVTVDGDDTVRASSIRLRVEVFGGAARSTPPQFPEEPKDDVTFDVSAASGWPRTLALVPENRDATRVYRVVATATDGSGDVVAIGRVISGYVMGEVRTVRVFLSAACDPLECEPSETCDPVREMCVPAEIPPEELPRFDGGVADGGGDDGGGADGGGADGGGIDAGMIDGGNFDGGMDGGQPDAGGFDTGSPGPDGGMDGGGPTDGGRDTGFDARDAFSDPDTGPDTGRDAGADARDASTDPDTGLDPASPLVFNEVDTVTLPGGDFAELYNPSASSITLDGLTVSALDLITCTVVQTFAVTGNIAPGGVAEASMPLPDDEIGLVLHRGATILAVESFAFPPLATDCFVEGSSVGFAAVPVRDLDTSSSLQRCPNGSGVFSSRPAPSYAFPNSCL